MGILLRDTHDSLAGTDMPALTHVNAPLALLEQVIPRQEHGEAPILPRGLALRLILTGCRLARQFGRSS